MFIRCKIYSKINLMIFKLLEDKKINRKYFQKLNHEIQAKKTVFLGTVFGIFIYK